MPQARAAKGKTLLPRARTEFLSSAKLRQRQGRVLFPKMLSYQSLRFSFYLIIINMASYCAKRRVFHVPIIPCFCHFATLIPHFSANLHLCIFPNIPANAAFSFVLPESDLRDIATDVPASAAFSFQRYHKRSAWHCPPMFRQAPLFGQKSVKRCNAAYWASRAAHLSRRVSLIFCFVLQ